MASVHRPRYFSNKENTPTIALTDIDAISTSLRSSHTSLSGAAPSHSSVSAASATAGGSASAGGKRKTTMLGIGRAPKFAVKRYKPYGRVSSITRAKKAAAGAGSAQAAKASRKAKAAGIKIEVKAPVETPKQAEERIKSEQRLEMWRKSVWRPEGGAQAGAVKVPLMLPYPSFPPVENVDMNGLRDVPVQYVREKLFPLLPSISTMTLAFRQFTNVSHPSPNTVPRGSTIPFAIPQVFDGTKPHWADKARGREPDIALQIVQRGHQREEGKPLIIPVMSVVFASQCAYWPKLTQPDHPAGPAGMARILAEAEKIKEEEEVSRGLPAIGEEEDDEAWASGGSGGSWSDTDSSDGDSVMSLDTPSPLPVPVKDARGFLYIPLVHLPVPSPRTFALIHRHLHHPARPLLPDLLNLPLECTTRPLVLEAIADLPVHELMEKLEVLQGVWQNLCCLGMGRVGTWRQLGEAWACVVGVIGGHGLMLQGVEEKPRGEKQTAAEDVAWEWAQMQKAKMA
ncbi:hypothetical protein IAT38_000172 [Cryptococcus sp. DSM 104549]